ncbi:MAG: hypothetical protein NTX03_00605, partial [Bacteroidetes bacterium]|nr:hypothetical protein [Bacteroidota bacterium]
DQIKEVKKYAKLVYPKNDLNSQIYNSKKFIEAATNVSKLRDLLSQVYDFVNDADRKQLFFDKGYTQTALDALLTIAETIRVKNNELVATQTDRQNSTQTRIGAHNALYAKLKYIKTCAEVVFLKNAAKRNLFSLVVKGKPLPTIFSFIVTDSHTGKKLRGAIITITGKKEYAPKTTSSRGTAKSKIANCSEKVDILITHPDYSNENLSGFEVKLREVNEVNIEM